MLEHLNDILENTQITASTAAVRLAISFVLGAIIGVERQFRRRDAGMRTFTLICMGSAAAMLISIWIPQTYPNFLNGDPGRIAAQVLTGIGFLGAGAIIQSHGSVHGLTTAACIWVMAVVGLAAGAGMFLAASITTAFTLFVLVSLERLERRMYLDGVNKILTINCSTLGFIDPCLSLDAIEYNNQQRYSKLLSIHGYLKEQTQYSASDAHYPEQIGTQPSIWQTEELTFDGLRKAFDQKDNHLIFASHG